MILLDTNAVVWLLANHARAKPLLKGGQELVASPAALLEVGFLTELGKIRLSVTLSDLREDSRFRVDDPSGAAWFAKAEELAFTRDPFDRLIVANALLRKAKLATGDQRIIDYLGPARVVAL